MILWGHSLEWVELAFEIGVEVLASLDNCVHDFESLLLSDTWSQWVLGEVSSNSDSRRIDHGLLLWSEFKVHQLLSVHVRDMLVCWSMLVVVLDHLIEKFVEFVEGILRSSVNTNSRVLVCNSRENASFERNTSPA